VSHHGVTPEMRHELSYLLSSPCPDSGVTPWWDTDWAVAMAGVHGLEKSVIIWAIPALIPC